MVVSTDTQRTLDGMALVVTNLRRLAKDDCMAWDALAEGLGIDLRARGWLADGRERIGISRPMGPNKYASPKCESGGHNYCTCKTCF